MDKISPQLRLAAFKRLMLDFPVNPVVDTRNGYQITRSDAIIYIDADGYFTLHVSHICENEYGSIYGAGEEIYKTYFLPSSYKFLKFVDGTSYVVEYPTSGWEGIEVHGRYYRDQMGK